MTITFFLLICLGCMASLFVMPAAGDVRRSGPFSLREIQVYVSWLIMGLAAVLMINHYTFPADKNTVFGNTDYHLVQHEGFRFEDSLQLVKGEFPRQSLWDTKTGEVLLWAKGDKKRRRPRPEDNALGQAGRKASDSLNSALKQDVVSNQHVASHQAPAFKTGLLAAFPADPPKSDGPGTKKEKTSESQTGTSENKKESEADPPARQSGSSAFGLETSRFFEPLFVKEDGFFVLKNNPYPVPVSAYLEIRRGKKSLLRMRLDPGSKGSMQYFIAFGDSGLFRRCGFNKTLSFGYPLAEILRRTPGWETYTDMVDQLDGCLLVRERQGDPGSNLYLFPSRSFHDSLGMHLVTEAESFTPSEAPTDFSLSLGQGSEFYAGLGMDKGPALRLGQDETGPRLELISPVRFRLQNEPVNELFLCSNLEDVVQNGDKSGYFFSLFDDKDNVHHIHGNLHYLQGSAREKLLARVIDHYAVTGKATDSLWGGTAFELATRSPETGVQWLMRLENLRATSPYTRPLLFGFILGLMALVFVTLYLVRLHKASPMEMMVYYLLFALLTVRILLQWRMSTFLPVDQVRPSEFAFLRSLSHFWKTAAITGLFFGGRWLLIADLADHPDGLARALGKLRLRVRKLFQGLAGSRWATTRESWLKGFRADSFLSFLRSFMMLAVPAVLLTFLFKLLGISVLERFLNIGIPAGLFFVFDYLIDQHRSARHHQFWGLNPASLFNGLFWLGFIGASDAGFSIIFLLFLLLYQAFRQLLQFSPRRKQTFARANLARGAAAFFLFTILLLGADEMITLLFEQTGTFFWLIILPVAFLAATYFGLLLWKSPGLPATQWRLRGLATGLAVAALLTIFNGSVRETIRDFSYVKYRAAIQNQSLDALIEEERFNSGALGQIMRAAQNKWFINTYLREQTFGKQEPGYFNLKPHFNKGSSYTTQTTDLVITRYVISEHGAGVVYVLLLLFLLTAGYYVYATESIRSRVFTPFGLLLLLFTISFFIWLTATNRFTFFGQDFPLLSLTSFFTLVFSLSMLLVVIVHANKVSATGLAERRSRRNRSLTVLLPFLVIPALFAVFQQRSSVIDEKQFDFNLSLEQARTDFNALNEEFKHFQNRVSGDPNPDSLVRAFYAQLEDTLISSSPFSQSIFEHFIHQQADKTDPENLLHLIRRRGKYRFSLNRNYYLIQPPKVLQNKWSGDLYAAREKGGGVYLMDLQNRERIIPVPGEKIVTNFETKIPKRVNKVNIAVVPASWVHDEQPAVLVWSDATRNGQDYSISNADAGADEHTQAFDNPAIRLRHEDLLNLHGPRGTRLRYRFLESHQHYLAKNIWLNGEQRLFFPLGEKLLWAYYYAEAINKAWSGSDSLLKRDVRVSVDYLLTEQLHSSAKKHFRKNHWERQRLGVVVANGNGQIRALVDYHPSGNIDPNDIDAFQDKNQEFYLRGNNSDERETFGNVNLLHLSNGPGSTLKPIMYAGITSQYNLGWRKLSLQPTPRSVLDLLHGEPKPNQTVEDIQNRFAWYGGKEVNMQWNGLNEQDFNSHTPQSYLVYSKNLYHSTVIFLGSYSKAWLMENLTTEKSDAKPPVLIPPQFPPTEKDFPMISLGNGPLVFNPEGWPRTKRGGDTWFGNRNSLLANGLYKNFDLPTFRERKPDTLKHTNIDPEDHDIFSRRRRGAQWYAYPEQAKFFQSDRAIKGARWFIYGFRQVVAGNDPVNTTPFKMAEMATKLYSFDRKLQLNLTDTLTDHQAEPFKADASWKGEYFNFVRDIIYGSMAMAIKTGTAAPLGLLLRQRPEKEDVPKYHYYAKTGTIRDSDDDTKLSDKLLMLIISKNKMTGFESPEELKANRFYVVYFTGLELGVPDDWTRWRMFAEMVTKIENTNLFKTYMNAPEPKK